jgi:hypothetical protein
MLKVICIFSFIVSSLFAYACEYSAASLTTNNNINNLESSIYQPLSNLVCSNFSKTTDVEILEQNLNSLVQNQTNSVIEIKNRHLMGEKLNTCSPTVNSKALVLSFAGTSAYNPRSHALMSSLVKCPQFQSLPDKYKKNVYSKLLSILKKKKSKFINWSGLDRGIMSRFLLNTNLRPIVSNLDFATFASEESELFADFTNSSNYSPSQIANEAIESVANSPIGISNATNCIKTYFEASERLNISPKLIILSHSSGGRSVVKLLEKIKAIKTSDLTLTIDPVVEVQHAIEEVTSQELGNLKRVLTGEEQKPLNVWSRNHPDSLYKVNSKKWFNFYQQSDTKGFNMNPSFGIQGSPVKDANNIFINGLGDQGHGEITYNDKVLNIMTTQILNLFEFDKKLE